MSLFSIAIGAVVGIVVGVVALVGVAAACTVLAVSNSKKKALQTSKQKLCVNPEHDNTKLFEKVKIENAAAGSTIIVPPTHAAVVLKNGNVSNIFSSGEFPLADNGETIHSLEVMFVSITLRVPVSWGTQEHNRFSYVDPKIGKPVSVGAFGEMKIRVSNPRVFYLELVANSPDAYSVEDLQEAIRKATIDATVRELLTVLTKNKVSYFDFTTAKYDIQQLICATLSKKFDSEYGFEVLDFIIENLNILDSEEKEIRRVYELSETQDALYDLERKDAVKRKRDAVADFDLDDELYRRKVARERDEQEYSRKQHERVRDDRMRDEDRAWEHEDKAREKDMRIKEKAMEVERDIEIARAKAQTPVSPKIEVNVTSNASDDSVICPFCHAKLPSGTMFCRFCGGKINK